MIIRDGLRIAIHGRAVVFILLVREEIDGQMCGCANVLGEPREDHHSLSGASSVADACFLLMAYKVQAAVHGTITCALP